MSWWANTPSEEDDIVLGKKKGEDGGRETHQTNHQRGQNSTHDCKIRQRERNGLQVNATRISGGLVLRRKRTSHVVVVDRKRIEWRCRGKPRGRFEFEQKHATEGIWEGEDEEVP